MKFPSPSEKAIFHASIRSFVNVDVRVRVCVGELLGVECQLYFVLHTHHAYVNVNVNVYILNILVANDELSIRHCCL